MTASTDPFDRAVSREEQLRKRADLFEKPSANMMMVIRWTAVMYVVWGAILAGHWLVLSDPHWLVVLHTFVYAVALGLSCLAAVFSLHMVRRREQVYGEG